MSIASFITRFRASARRFIGADEGNIAIIFAITALPILGLVGAAIDYSRVSNARARMQSALDTTALMLSKDLASGAIAAADVATKAQNYFNALYTNKAVSSVGNVSVTATYNAVTSMGSTIQVTGSGSMTTDFLKVAGFSQLNIGASSTTAWGNARMRVALALDNTGSMAKNGKIAALRTAVAGTGGLIDQLSKLAQTPGDVLISVIPFAKVVNVGTSNYSQNWIDWTDWQNPPTAQPNNGSKQATLPSNWHAVGPGATCPFTNSSGGFVCTTGPANASSTSMSGGTNVIPSSGTYSGYICPSIDANSHAFYNGCWDSEPTNTKQTFCSGSSSCSCNGLASGSSCSCTGSGSSTTCTAYTYVHKWTQQAVVANVGYPNNKWTASNPTPSIANNWTPASTNLTSTWTGCVTDRSQPNDATGDGATTSDVTTLFPANQYYENSTAYCDSSASTKLEPIIPLSYAWGTLKDAVNAMQPTGGTNQAIGLAWAWQTLLPNSPLPAPAEDANTTYNRVIILLSDGLNTEDRWPDYGDGSSQFNGSIDDRQTALCTKLKNTRDARGNLMYTIYTIQVNTESPADPTSTVLQSCASSLDKSYMLTNANQIVTTFNTIGTALSQLRVAR